MKEFVHHDKCPNEFVFETKEFEFNVVYYCNTCGKYYVEEKPCDHQWRVIDFEILNGSYQIRKFCETCKNIDRAILPRKDYLHTTLPKKNLQSYHAYYDKIRDEDSKKVSEFKSELYQRAEAFRKTDYTAYLKSDHWVSTRTMIFERDNHICRMCGERAEEVHHITYKNRGHEYEFELVSLCSKCHREYHGID